MKTTLKQHQIRTKRPTEDSSPTPRLPHERDESEDSQEDAGYTTGKDVAGHADIRQAYDDLQQGQVDTDLRNTGGVDEVVNRRPGQSPDKVVKKSF